MKKINVQNWIPIEKIYDNGIIFCNCAGNSGNEIYRSNVKKTYSLDEWLQEIIQRAHIGLMDELFGGTVASK